MSSAVSTDPTYIAARRILLNALDALVDHLDAIVVVGAQAVYLHTNDAELDATVAPFTTDADLALHPARLASEPALVAAMRAAGFTLKIKRSGGVEPGSWLASVSVDGTPRQVPIDLIVPAALAPGHGRRDARLPTHGQHAARWADGLEAAVIDNSPMTISSLDPDNDQHTISVRVAGIAALLIAKCYKLHDRLHEGTGREHRIRSKDAGDVVRLMRGPMNGAALGVRLSQLAVDPLAGASVRTGVDRLRKLFASPRAPGVMLAVAALAGALDEDQVRAIVPGFVADVLAAYEQ